MSGIDHKNLRCRAGALACIVILSVWTASCSAEAEPDYSRTPVILIHGYGMNSSDWDVMIGHLTRAGYPRAYVRAVEIRPNIMGNIQAAETAIASAVDRLIADAESAAIEQGHSPAPEKKVDLVSHSMGAVSARWYTVMIGPERVRVWLSIGGSNHGSDVLCSYRGDGAADLCPAYAGDREKNRVQVDLNGTPDQPVDETPWGLGEDPDTASRISPDDDRRIAYFTIRIEPDEWIEPAKSATLSGAGAGIALGEWRQFTETTPGNLLYLSNSTHDDLMHDHPVMAMVEFLLRQSY